MKEGKGEEIRKKRKEESEGEKNNQIRLPFISTIKYTALSRLHGLAMENQDL